MTTLKAAALFAAFSIAGALTACIHDSDADSSAGPTQAQFDALVARVAALETDLGTNTIVLTSGGATANGKQKMADISQLCTLLGYAPADMAGQMTVAECKTSTGMIARVPITESTSSFPLALLIDTHVYYTTPDCTGQAYIHYSQVGETGLATGYVFGYYDGSIVTGYVAAGSQYAEIDQASRWSFDGTTWSCDPLSGMGLFAVPVNANAPSITGMPNTVTGPTSIF